jgi:hypothetical protein
MHKKLIVFFFIVFSGYNYACERALPVDHPQFCLSFKSVASCHCTTSGLPYGMCQDVHMLYNRMIAVFKTLEKACQYQQHTSPQDCMNNWNCYLKGGVDSEGHLCSSTGRACE